MSHWRDLFGGGTPAMIPYQQVGPAPTGAPGSTNIVQGQRVEFARGADNKLLNNYVTLMRGQDKEAGIWQLTIAPVFRRPVGPDVLGMPQQNNGFPRLRLTWGGGGVTFRNEFFLPAVGASFSVAGEEVMCEVAPTDFSTVYTDDNVPCMVGWLKATDSPGQSNLFATSQQAAPVPPSILPAFARTVQVCTVTPGATSVITFSGGPGPLTASYALPAGPQRVNVPEWAQRYAVTTSAGDVTLSWEFRFS